MSNIIIVSLPDTLMERITVPLNGIWELHGADIQTPFSDLPEVFENTIPVPGLWDMAEEPIRTNAAWYHKTLRLNGSIPKSAMLKINKAFWGKYIYVNGRHVCDHHPNFTPAYVDISSYLNEGDNSILIKIGAYGTQDKSLGHAVGYDKEKLEYIPGIYDDVCLIFSGTPALRYIQAAPQASLDCVHVQVTLLNPLAENVVTDVSLIVHEHNTGKEVGNGIIPAVKIPAGNSVKSEITISLANAHLWSPEDPFLYDVSAATDGDCLTVSFGMREFHFDKKSKRPMLNGQCYYLRGNNITMYRFFEDPNRGALPWSRDWARKVLQSFKSLNMNSVRYCIGFPPELWYELADEIGLLVDDEYPIWWELGRKEALGDYPYWGKLLPPMEDTLIPELIDWINERANHPCVNIWDIQNETVCYQTETIIKKLRESGTDLSNRPWDNGWGPPASPTDPLECHPYLFINPHFTMAQANTVDKDPAARSPQFYNYSRLPDMSLVPDNPRIINEYAWLWINRDASPTTLTERLYQNLLPGGSAEMRREYYAQGVAKLTEFWRSGRKAAGVLYFCGLTYCKPGGFTCDAFLENIANPAYDPLFQKMMADAMAPLGICIGDLSEEHAPGEKSFPVQLYNDLPEPWDGIVTVQLTPYKSQCIFRQELSFHVAAFGTAEQKFRLTIPNNLNTRYRLTASYLNGQGEIIQSVRDFLVLLR